MFFIEDGWAQCLKGDEAVCEIGPACYYGEKALVEDMCTRRTTIIGLTNGILHILYRKDLLP
jgi:hypothetical protein